MIRKRKVNAGSHVKVTFFLPENHRPGNVSVVGDFNDWAPKATRLVRRANRTRSATVTLESGRRYAFRYLADDGHWFNDNQADGWEPSGYGSDNCLLQT